MNSQEHSRRMFVKKAAYVAPAILTLAATPAYAIVGSGPLTQRSQSESLPEPQRVQPTAIG